VFQEGPRGSPLLLSRRRNGPAPWPATATYIGSGDKLPSPVSAKLDATFPKGAALAD
jgi:hypothetical protein